MAKIKEKVLDVKHYTDTLFYFKTTRDPGTRFTDGEFMMVGMEINGKPLLRAYSVVSPNHQEHLEFYSIKIPDGPLTSKLKDIKIGDDIVVNTRSTGTLINQNLIPGRNLYLMATGTGIAPFMSIARGTDTYKYYDKVIIVWGARFKKELPFKEYLEGLNDDPMYKDITQNKLYTYMTTTREESENEGRVTSALYEGKIQDKLGLEPLDAEHDRVMICGSMPMNLELKEFLEDKGFKEGTMKEPGTYVLEKAFVG
jgi:ferredoxin--NADP+ reductase